MSFLSSLVSSGLGNTLIQAGAAVASGKSAGDVAKKMATAAQTGRLENYFMQAADAYSSGYSTFNAAGATKFGAAGLVAVVAWITATLVQKGRTENGEEGTGEEGGPAAPAVAGTAAFFSAFLTVMIISIVRRQKTFSNFTGTNMFIQYAAFFCVPFVLFSAGLGVASPLDAKKSVAVAAAVAVAIVAVAKKFYFVFKQNDLEKQVFTQIANVLDACQTRGKAGCSHKHAGYLEAFANMVKPYIDQMNYVLPVTLEAAEVARDIASRQIFDTLRGQV